jgi:hypothetical protein
MALTQVLKLISGTPSLDPLVITMGSDLPLPVIPVLVTVPPLIVVPVGVVDQAATGTARHR